MPFEHYAAYCFTPVSVQKNAPEASGVYGLSTARDWVFVAETDNIKATLLEHFEEARAFLNERAPTGFTFEVCAACYRLARQGRLIAELEPVCKPA